MTKNLIPDGLNYTAERIRFDLRFWLDAQMANNLGDLHRLLEEVQDEMIGVGGDALIVDHWDELEVAAGYISAFGAPTEQEEDLDVPYDFDYRLANVEEDLMHVEQLIEGLGESFKISDLPIPIYVKKIKVV